MTESAEDRGRSDYSVTTSSCLQREHNGNSYSHAGAFKAHLVIDNFFSQTGRHHLLQSFLFALCLSSQLCRAVTKPGNVVLGGQNNKLYIKYRSKEPDPNNTS